MKTIKSLKDITTLEVGDKVVFGNLEHTVVLGIYGYYLSSSDLCNTRIFDTLNVNKNKFIESLGIHANYAGNFPETKSLEALTTVVSALFKEYEKQNKLPKTWEEFCKKNYARNVYFIGNNSLITCVSGYMNSIKNKNVCISKQEAEAFLALMQLRQLRKAYVGNWEPDWKNNISAKYCIEVDSNELLIHNWYHKSHILSFPSCGLATQFLNNFKNLLEIAKPLL